MFNGELVWCLFEKIGSRLRSQDQKQEDLPESSLASQLQAQFILVLVVGNSMCSAARIPGFTPAFCHLLAV